MTDTALWIAKKILPQEVIVGDKSVQGSSENCPKLFDGSVQIKVLFSYPICFVGLLLIQVGIILLFFSFLFQY